MMDNKEMDLFEGWTRESVLNERERMRTVKAKAIKDLEDSPLAKRQALSPVTAPPLLDQKKALKKKPCQIAQMPWQPLKERMMIILSALLGC